MESYKIGGSMKVLSLFLVLSLIPFGKAFSYEGNPLRLSFGMGYMEGDYDAITSLSNSNTAHGTGGYGQVSSFSLGIEYFTDVNRSYIAKVQAAARELDFIDQTEHTYIGFGKNFYLGNSNIESGLSERWLPYAGYDIGWSRTTVLSFGPDINILSDAVDLGGHLGTNYRLDKKWAINLEAALSYAIGLSTTAINGINTKVFLGLSRLL